MNRRGFLVALALGSGGCVSTALRDGGSSTETDGEPGGTDAARAETDGTDTATDGRRTERDPAGARTDAAENDTDAAGNDTDAAGSGADAAGDGSADGAIPPAETDIDIEFRSEEHPERESVRVGDGVPSDDVRPHEVVVWNDGPEREIRVDVSADSRDLNVSRSVALAEDEYLTFRLTEQVDYRALVGAGAGSRYRFALSDGFVDCNGSRTTVRVPPSGPVEYLSISTRMGCPGPDDDGVRTATDE